MKYQIKLLISILTIGILFTGCARRSYDTSDQLVLGISENLPLYSTDSFGETIRSFRMVKAWRMIIIKIQKLRYC